VYFLGANKKNLKMSALQHVATQFGIANPAVHFIPPDPTLIHIPPPPSDDEISPEAIPAATKLAAAIACEEKGVAGAIRHIDQTHGIKSNVGP
jgi:hypothetical protein